MDRALAELSPAGQRAWAALVGAVVADAAAVPCHWQYDAKKLAEQLGSSDPAFFDDGPRPNPFYVVPLGANSCYGDQLVTTISSTASTSPAVSSGDIADRFYERFTSDDYASVVEAKKMYGYKGQQQQEKTPIPGPWRHGTIENFLKARDAGSSEIDDADVSVDALVRSLPAAAAAGVAGIDPDESVDAAVVVTQTSPIVRRYAKAFGRAMAHVITTGEKANIVAPEDDDGDLRELLETVKDVAGGGEASAGSEEDGFVDSVQTLRTKLPAYAEASPFKIIA